MTEKNESGITLYFKFQFLLISYTLTAWNSQYLVTIKKNVSKSLRAVSVNLTEADNLLSGKLSPVYTVRIPHLGTWQASEGEGEIKKKQYQYPTFSNL